MPKLRHIALAAEDSFAAAEFYKQADKVIFDIADRPWRGSAPLEGN